MKDTTMIWIQRLGIIFFVFAFVYTTGWKGFVGFLIGIAATVHVFLTSRWAVDYFVDALKGDDVKGDDVGKD